MSLIHDGDDDGDLNGPGGLDRVLDDLHWREHTGDDAERVYREAVRRGMALAQGGSTSRAIVLVQVLNRLGELSGFDASDLWTRL